MCFYTLFYSHVFQKNTNNIIQTILPNRPAFFWHHRIWPRQFLEPSRPMWEKKKVKSTILCVKSAKDFYKVVLGRTKDIDELAIRRGAFFNSCLTPFSTHSFQRASQSHRPCSIYCTISLPLDIIQNRASDLNIYHFNVPLCFY